MTKLNSTCLYTDNRADDIFHSFKYTERETETYDTVKRKLDEHFVLQRNSIFEHALFNSRRQEPGELVEEFITALYTLIEHCEYGTRCDQMIVMLLVATLHVGMTGFQDGGCTQLAQLQWDYLRWVKISFTHQ